MTLDRVWVSIGPNILILLDKTKGDILHYLKDSLVSITGKHTVNSDRELIYIDKNKNISKLSADMNTPTLLIDETDPEWKPIFVYCSPSSGDLMVGMRGYDTHTDTFKGKVMRYNDSCPLIEIYNKTTHQTTRIEVLAI